jgi:hypothetical protein
VLATPVSAELMIAPTRVVLGPGQRTAELVLVNRGSEKAAFRLQVENRRMRADGSMEAADTAKPDELFAAGMVRFSPRQLVLEPGARQTVRVTAEPAEGQADGEYRSHLRLMSAPVSAGRTEAPAATGDDRSLSIELIAVRSLTIPVLVRLGTLDAEAKIMGAAFSKAQPGQLIVSMTRTGSRSTYGDIRLTPAGAVSPAYVVRGIAIYTPNTDRDVVVPLPDDVRRQRAGKQVRVDYVSADPASPGKTSTATVGL